MPDVRAAGAAAQPFARLFQGEEGPADTTEQGPPATGVRGAADDRAAQTPIRPMGQPRHHVGSVLMDSLGKLASEVQQATSFTPNGAEAGMEAVAPAEGGKVPVAPVPSRPAQAGPVSPPNQPADRSPDIGFPMPRLASPHNDPAEPFAEPLGDPAMGETGVVSRAPPGSNKTGFPAGTPGAGDLAGAPMQKVEEDPALFRTPPVQAVAEAHSNTPPENTVTPNIPQSLVTPSPAAPETPVVFTQSKGHPETAGAVFAEGGAEAASRLQPVKGGVRATPTGDKSSGGPQMLAAPPANQASSPPLPPGAAAIEGDLAALTAEPPNLAGPSVASSTTGAIPAPRPEASANPQAITAPPPPPSQAIQRSAPDIYTLNLELDGLTGEGARLVLDLSGETARAILRGPAEALDVLRRYEQILRSTLETVIHDEVQVEIGDREARPDGQQHHATANAFLASTKPLGTPDTHDTVGAVSASVPNLIDLRV